MNYFHYFTEIEETFVRRRGKHLHLGTLDWALMQTWKESGIPLHVAIRGIETAFDSYESKPRKRSVKTLLYCQEEVEAQYAEWLESQTGSAQPPSSGESKGEDRHLPFPKPLILEHLQSAQKSLLALREQPISDSLASAIARALIRLGEIERDFSSAVRPHAEALEDSLTSLERLLDEALLSSVSDKEVAVARADAERQLAEYRKRMDQQTYEQTLTNLMMKRLRDSVALPRLSLFYI